MKMKKLIAGMLAAVMIIGSVSVFASESSELPKLTIADAVKNTLASDTGYLNLLDTGKLNVESRTDTLNNYFENFGKADDGSD